MGGCPRGLWTELHSLSRECKWSSLTCDSLQILFSVASSVTWEKEQRSGSRDTHIFTYVFPGLAGMRVCGKSHQQPWLTVAIQNTLSTFQANEWTKVSPLMLRFPRLKRWGVIIPNLYSKGSDMSKWKFQECRYSSSICIFSYFSSNLAYR